MRYPRGTGPGAAIEQEMASLPLGKGLVRRASKARSGHRIALLAFGSMVAPALAAAEQFDATVADMRFVKPLDVALVQQLARSHDALVTLEENVVHGGAGSAVLEALAASDLKVPVLQLGLPDRFVDHGDTTLLQKECGLDPAGIAAAIRQRFTRSGCTPRARSPEALASLRMKPIAIVQHEADVVAGNFDASPARRVEPDYESIRIHAGDTFPQRRRYSPASVHSAAT